MKQFFLTGLFIITVLSGCGGPENKSNNNETVETVLPEKETIVTTETLRTIDFEHELISNGRISARQVAELQFSTSSSDNIPVRIFVKNGDRVRAGTAIAMVDTFRLSNSYRQAKDNLQKAYLELQDVLIGQGFSLSDSASIPCDILQLAHVRSGYNNAKNAYNLAKYELDKAVLRTPISGTVANLFSKPYCTVNTSEPFCIIINESRPEVDFKILENELPLIKKGDKVKIQSYASPEIETTGFIESINPSVDEEGTVQVKAYIKSHSKMFNGMNVRISVFRSLGKQWVVRKTAVVLRTGKEVVFTFKDDKAAWNYVTTTFENATHYAITSKTLQEGDEIIVSGNEHLANESEVKRIEE